VSLPSSSPKAVAPIGYINNVIRSVLLLILSTLACGQKLEISSASADRGSANFVRIVLKASPEKPVVAVQFELAFPHSLEIEGKEVVTGDAADAVGKSITCALRPPQAEGGRCACILAGGREPLVGGTIVIVKFGAAADASPGVVKLQVQNGAGVSPDLKSVPIANAEATITIR